MEQWNFGVSERERKLEVYKSETENINNDEYSEFTVKQFLKIRYIYEIASVFAERDGKEISELIDLKNSLDRNIEDLENMVDTYKQNLKAGENNEQIKVGLFGNFERDKRDVIDKILNWIMKEKNYTKKKRQRKYFLTEKDIRFIYYLLNIYEDNDIERKILKNGRYAKTITNQVYCECYPNQYKEFLEGIWEGIQGFVDSGYIELKTQEVKKYWLEHYGMQPKKGDVFIKKQDLKDRLILQKMTLSDRIDRLLSLIETDSKSVEMFCDECDAFLDRTEGNEVYEEFNELKEQMIRELCAKEDFCK